MKIKDIIEALECDVLVEGGSESVGDGYTSDLLSDVMGNCPEGGVWITIQRHMNVIAVAQLKRIAAIILVNNAAPEEAVIERAKEEGIYILVSKLNAFQVSGKVYNLFQTQR